VKKAWRACLGASLLLTASACHRREPAACREYFERYQSCFERLGPKVNAVMREHLQRQQREIDRLSKTADRSTLERQCMASLGAIEATCRR
jgi:hypothetical protein